MNSKVFSAVLAVLGLVLGSAPVVAQEETETPEPVQYVMEKLAGDVTVLSAGGTEAKRAKEGQLIRSGDEVRVGTEGEAVLMTGLDTTVRLGEKSRLKVERIEDNGTGGFFSRLKLFSGRVLSQVQKLSTSKSSFEVESGGVVCGVRGTAFEVAVDGDDVQAATHEGEVEVRGQDRAERVGAGYHYGFRKGRFLAKRKLDRMEKERFGKWLDKRKGIREKRLKRLDKVRKYRLKQRELHRKRALQKRQLRKSN